LTDEADVWSQNAWDHVPPPNDQAEIIAKSLSKQRSNPVPLEDKDKFNEKPAKHWYAPIFYFPSISVERFIETMSQGQLLQDERQQFLPESQMVECI